MTYSSLVALLAQEEENNGQTKWYLVGIVLTANVTFQILLGVAICYQRKRELESKGNFFLIYVLPYIV